VLASIRTYANCARLSAQRVGEIPLSLTQGAQAHRSLPEERERTRRQTRRRRERSRCEIHRLFPPGFIRPSPISLSLSLSLPLSLSLSLYVAPAGIPLRVRSRTYVRAARGVTNPLENHTAAATVGISPCHWPQTTLGNQWKAQIRGRLPVRGNESGKLPANRTAHRSLALPVLGPGPPPLGFNPRFAPPHHTAPRVLAVTSECWKLRRLVAITARIAIGRRPVRPFARD